MDAARTTMATLASAGVLKLDSAELLPIGKAEHDRDIFLLAKSGSRLAGAVFWHAGEEVDRFASFEDFFLSMIEYNKQDLNDLRQEWMRRRH